MNLLFCQDFQHNIKVLQDENYSKFLYCAVRGRKISLNNEPEEFIRQCLLYYLVHLSKTYPDLIDIKVEFNNADIVIFPVLPTDFKPFIPLLVIETKVYTNVNTDKKQLFEYLKQFRCSVGFLFDGNSLICFENLEKKNLKTLDDFKEVITRELYKVSYAENYNLFKQSQVGCLDAFKKLSAKYDYADIVFEYKTLSGDLLTQCGKFFRFTDTELLYNLSGNYTKHKQRIELKQFKRVLNLRE